MLTMGSDKQVCFRALLKVSNVSQSLIYAGNSFHNLGAAEANHLSQYVIVLVFGITSLIELFCDLKFLPGL